MRLVAESRRPEARLPRRLLPSESSAGTRVPSEQFSSFRGKHEYCIIKGGVVEHVRKMKPALKKPVPAALASESESDDEAIGDGSSDGEEEDGSSSSDGGAGSGDEDSDEDSEDETERAKRELADVPFGVLQVCARLAIAACN